MRTIELFSGTKSFSKVAHKLGHSTFTIDNNSDLEPNLCMDFLKVLPIHFMGMEYDICWASPPCTAFSVASIGKHWAIGNIPKSVTAEFGLKLLDRTIEWILVVKPKEWYIENPRGMMRKVIDEIFKKQGITNYRRITVSYCSYNDYLVQELIFKMVDKKCPSCGEIKDICTFYKNISRRDGFSVYCKDCIADSSKEYHLKNKEKCRKRLQEWRGKNKDYIKLRDKKYIKENPDIEFNKQQRYRENHKEKLFLKGKKYREEHKDYFYNKARERKLSQEKVSDGSVTLEFENYIYELQERKCAYCKCELQDSGKHLDHIIPISRGGLHTTNNVQWTCPTCNLSKNDKLEEDWIKKERCKPTDIWTNNHSWNPRPICKNGDKCHISAPRGSKTGTQGLKNAKDRGVIPEQLFLEIFEQNAPKKIKV